MVNSVAIGVGCRKNVAGANIVALVRQALARLPRAPHSARLFSVERKAGEMGLREAAAALGFELTFLPEAQLATRQSEFLARGATSSKKAREVTGLDSVAESCALFGAGDDAVLLCPRMVGEGATCAIAGAPVECRERP